MTGFQPVQMHPAPLGWRTAAIQAATRPEQEKVDDPTSLVLASRDVSRKGLQIFRQVRLLPRCELQPEVTVVVSAHRARCVPFTVSCMEVVSDARRRSPKERTA
jgi:hypothetical protein